MFEVDCTTNQVTGIRQDLVDQLTRAYVRAAPGRLVETTFDPVAGTLTASGADAPAGAELLAFYPSARLGAAGAVGQGLDDVRLVPATSGDTYVVARAAGGAWSLSLAPAADAARAR